jgi:hypothetical protein
MRFCSGWRTVIGTAMALVLAAGCASNAPKPAPNPASISEDTYGTIKSSYLSANPNARVGRVAAVLAGSNRLSVTDVPLADFRKGDVLSVVDGKLNPIANGAVVEIDSDYLYVDFEPASATSRSPQAGDMAIRAETPTR